LYNSIELSPKALQNKSNAYLPFN